MGLPRRADDRQRDDHRFVLTLSCPDRTGIVARITTFLADIGGWIIDAAYHSDEESGRFFTRQEIRADSLDFDADELRAPVRARSPRRWTPTIGRWSTPPTASGRAAGQQGGPLPLRPARPLALRRDWTSTSRWSSATTPTWSRSRGCSASRSGTSRCRATTRARRPRSTRSAARSTRTHPDAIVLARFMQVIPADLCEAWDGRLINIHHGFLPSFRGARPYHQAYARGVKLIGATCHYVTAELDAGPIIEQDVIQVDHADSPADMVRRGRDIEKAVLAKGLTLPPAEPGAAGRPAHHRLRLTGSGGDAGSDITLPAGNAGCHDERPCQQTRRRHDHRSDPRDDKPDDSAPDDRTDNDDRRTGRAVRAAPGATRDRAAGRSGADHRARRLHRCRLRRQARRRSPAVQPGAHRCRHVRRRPADRLPRPPARP